MTLQRDSDQVNGPQKGPQEVINAGPARRLEQFILPASPTWVPRKRGTAQRKLDLNAGQISLRHFLHAMVDIESVGKPRARQVQAVSCWSNGQVPSMGWLGRLSVGRAFAMTTRVVCWDNWTRMWAASSADAGAITSVHRNFDMVSAVGTETTVSTWAAARICPTADLPHRNRTRAHTFLIR